MHRDLTGGRRCARSRTSERCAFSGETAPIVSPRQRDGTDPIRCMIESFPLAPTTIQNGVRVDDRDFT